MLENDDNPDFEDVLQPSHQHVVDEGAAGHNQQLGPHESGGTGVDKGEHFPSKIPENDNNTLNPKKSLTHPLNHPPH